MSEKLQIDISGPATGSMRQGNTVVTIDGRVNHSHVIDLPNPNLDAYFDRETLFGMLGTSVRIGDWTWEFDVKKAVITLYVSEGMLYKSAYLRSCEDMTEVENVRSAWDRKILAGDVQVPRHRR